MSKNSGKAKAKAGPAQSIPDSQEEDNDVNFERLIEEQMEQMRSCNT
jgi:hypothetical protein